MALIEIEQVFAWFICFFEKLNVTNIDDYIDFSTTYNWHSKLYNLTKNEVAIGLVNYIDLFEQAEKCQINILKITPQIFKNLCKTQTIR